MMIVPAILAKSRDEFIEKIKLVTPHVNRVQFDIMDGKFVPNKTWGTPYEVVKNWENLALKNEYEVHLMVMQPQTLIKLFVKHKAKIIYFHYEAVKNPQFILGLIDKYNKGKKQKSKKGIAINPETPVKKIEPFLNDLDAVLVMGVNPGFSGQKFQKVALRKIRQIKKINPQIEVGVDGGVNLENAKEITAAGCDYLVAASAIFESNNIKETINNFKSIANYK